MGGSVSSRNQTGTSSSTISAICSPKFSLCFVPSWWLQSSPSLGIKEVDCQIVPQASVPLPPRSPRSSAPATPPCSSTTATPPTVQRGSLVTRLQQMLGRAIHAELQKEERDMNRSPFI